jgi:hypothetical protein
VKDRPTEFPDRLRPTELASEAERIREEGRKALLEEVEDTGLGVEAPPRARPYGKAGQRRARKETFASRFLRDSLRGDPRGLQKAVLYREVLGPPLGTRGTGGWEDPS